MNTIATFKAFIWNFYQQNKRPFAWRNTNNPYYILISEVMLQQTQTQRVIDKYEEFIINFPTLQALAESSLRDVLSVWQGLGYYRRARYLHQLARIVVTEHNGILPKDTKILQTLPGIGPGTAGSISAFAFNNPSTFIETNIRAVFIHCFFQDKINITDKELLPLVCQTVDQENPREWYYALMDYGVWLKAQQTNPSRKSAHYTKQSVFKGSNREIRAQILKLITEQELIEHNNLLKIINKNSDRVERIIDTLIAEHFIKKSIHDIYSIT